VFQIYVFDEILFHVLLSPCLQFSPASDAFINLQASEECTRVLSWSSDTKATIPKLRLRTARKCTFSKFDLILGGYVTDAVSAKLLVFMWHQNGKSALDEAY
jgi:hypothetical protein